MRLKKFSFGIEKKCVHISVIYVYICWLLFNLSVSTKVFFNRLPKRMRLCGFFVQIYGIFEKSFNHYRSNSYPQCKRYICENLPKFWKTNQVSGFWVSVNWGCRNQKCVEIRKCSVYSMASPVIHVSPQVLIS